MMAMIYVKDKDALPNRREFDHYPTDPITTAAGVRLARLFVEDVAPWILDPGAGRGVWGTACRRMWHDAYITGVDIRELPQPDAYNAWIQGDFLTAGGTRGGSDLVIGNPPYIHAEEFCRKALDFLRPGGILLYLLRLTFLESKRRLRFFREDLPRHVAVLSRRPSFMEDGSRKTSPDAYAFYVWQKGYRGETTLSWINTDEEGGLSLWRERDE